MVQLTNPLPHKLLVAGLISSFTSMSDEALIHGPGPHMISAGSPTINKQNMMTYVKLISENAK